MRRRLMVEQEFPGFGKRGLREESAKKDAEAMQYEVEAMTRDLVMMVKETCFDLSAVQRAVGQELQTGVPPAPTPTRKGTEYGD